MNLEKGMGIIAIIIAITTKIKIGTGIAIFRLFLELFIIISPL